MVRRHFHRQMPAFRNPGLHSFAEKKSKWEKVGKTGKRWEKAVCRAASLSPPSLHNSLTPALHYLGLHHSTSHPGSKPRLVIPLPIIPLPEFAFIRGIRAKKMVPPVTMRPRFAQANN